MQMWARRLRTQGGSPTPLVGSLAFAQVTLPHSSHEATPHISIPSNLKQCWVIRVRVSVSDLTYLAGPLLLPTTLQQLHF